MSDHRKFNIADAFSRIPEIEKPHIVADVNDFQVKLSKLKGPFVWHQHEQEDELFLIVKGQLRMKFRDGDVILNKGEMIVVPHGVEHCPEADEETHVVLFERNTTLNTGNVRNAKTVETLERLT
jgi:mannose-6-phosphate isomerase-like protein (cupin superfamily)